MKLIKKNLSFLLILYQAFKGSWMHSLPRYVKTTVLVDSPTIKNCCFCRNLSPSQSRHREHHKALILHSLCRKRYGDRRLRHTLGKQYHRLILVT